MLRSFSKYIRPILLNLLPNRSRPRLSFSRYSAEPTLRGIALSIISSVVEALYRNKIAATSALIGLLVIVPLVLTSRYDERSRYRQVILPRIQQLEDRYRLSLELAGDSPSDSERVYYFLDAHQRAIDVLKFIRDRRAVTQDGQRAHLYLIRYYQLVDDHFAILRSEMSINQDIDFVARWDEVTQSLQKIYDEWSTWVEG